MKRSLVFAMVSLAVGIVIFSTKNSTDRTDRTDETGLRPPRDPRPATAHVPDPGRDLPVTSIRPEDLGVFPPSAPIDHPARIARAISEDNLPAIQSAALSWFEVDPAAARDWLAIQPTYDDLQPAISYIVSKISERGDLKTALEWSALLKESTLRDDTLFSIHALALRNGNLKPSEIARDLIPNDRLDELLSGAAGD